MTNTSFSQNYEDLFGLENTQWNITIGNLWGIGTTEHRITGDTIIDGLSYKIINGYDTFDNISGYIRKDSLNQKAWYRNNQNNDEYLIMNLSLEIGDSLYIGGVWNSEHKFYKVDSVYVKDNRKHIQFNLPLHFADIEKFTLIEGVVSNMGFRYQDNDYINGLPTILLCAFKDDEKIYGEGECIISSTENLETGLNLEVFPNPVFDNLTIKLTEDISEGKIEIFDVTGIIVYQRIGRIDKFELIDFSSLNSGMYFIDISDYKRNLKRTSKIIK